MDYPEHANPTCAICGALASLYLLGRALCTAHQHRWREIVTVADAPTTPTTSGAHSNAVQVVPDLTR